MANHDSKFDAGLWSYVWLLVWTGFINIITLMLAYPWTMAAKYGWKIRHTIINGRRLGFDGSGGQLIWQWIKWWFLSLITLGIYSLWVPIKLEKWRVSHTFLR